MRRSVEDSIDLPWMSSIEEVPTSHSKPEWPIMSRLLLLPAWMKSMNKRREPSTKLLKPKLQQQESREQHWSALKLWVEPWQKFLPELLEVSLFQE